MNEYSNKILRVGLAVTFVWIGILILKNPEAWGGYIQPWAARLLPFDLVFTMKATAALDIAIGFLFLVKSYSWLAGLLASLHLIIVLITSGITDITVRDIGLLAASAAVYWENRKNTLRSHEVIKS